MDHLFRRYKTDQIYTYMGDILIAINPFKEIDIYGERVSACVLKCSSADDVLYYCGGILASEVLSS